jgi:hypothetical protein
MAAAQEGHNELSGEAFPFVVAEPRMLIKILDCE